MLTDRAKRSIMMLADAIVLGVALWSAVILRYGELDKDVSSFWWLFPTAALLGIISFRKFGLYRAIVRYIGPSAMLPVIQGVSIATLGVSLIAYLSGAYAFPRSAPLIFWFIAILMVGGSRILVRAYFYGVFNNYLMREPVAIYGAGDSGAQLAITLLGGNEYMPVAFIDDDRSKRKNTIHGIRVYDSGHIDRLVNDLGIKQILLAIPSATAQQRKAILNRLTELPVHVRTVPCFDDLIAGRADVAQIQEVDIGDLLGRDKVPPDEALLRASIKGKSVLVTGAGGTIGAELCRKIVAQQPKRLVLYDNSELALYHMESELQRSIEEGMEIRFILGSVLNLAHLNMVLSDFAIETVYHAAAYKHVPMVERNIIEGVRNNVIGTWRVAQADAANPVEVFVMISPAQAVRPTHALRASKPRAELIVQAFAEQHAKTRFCMVRFGNVLGSSGSVVPLFEKQIRTGGPVTVTHKDASRYFMTSSEAAELVIQAGALAEGGEVFVLDMGELVKIQDLAEQMIHLHGKQVKSEGADEADADQCVDIVYIGLRPGEKLFEELIIGENVSGTRHPKILKADEECLDWNAVERLCRQLEQACEGADYLQVKKSLEDHVLGYTMADATVDPVLQLESRPHPSNITPFPKPSS